MPLAGQRIRALDFPDAPSDTQPGVFTITNSVYSTASTGGTYADCGVAFLAPTSGRVMILYAARAGHSVDGLSVQITPVVREGAVIGSGADIVAASSENMIDIQAGNDGGNSRSGANLPVSGLTPGQAYNVRLEHLVGAPTGTIQSRTVTATPLPGPPV